MTIRINKYRYRTNEEVKENDIVITGNEKEGVVEKVIAPGSRDSKDFNCLNGGILIKENWQGESSYLLMTPPDGESWEDLVFIRRAEDEG